MRLLSRKNLLILTVLAAVCFFMMPQQKAEAFDPVTLAIVAPLALQAAKVVAPYVFKAAANMGIVIARATVDLLGIIRLPIGLVECTLLAPWTFRAGLKNIGLGLAAPFKFCGWILLVPVSPLGIGVNWAKGQN